MRTLKEEKKDYQKHLGTRHRLSTLPLVDLVIIWMDLHFGLKELNLSFYSPRLSKFSTHFRSTPLHDNLLSFFSSVTWKPSCCVNSSVHPLYVGLGEVSRFNQPPNAGDENATWKPRDPGLATMATSRGGTNKPKIALLLRQTRRP